MFKSLALISVLTSAAWAQSTVGSSSSSHFHIVHYFFRQPIPPALLQTLSFRQESVPLAPLSWINLTAIPALMAVFLRWWMSHLPSPPGAQPLHHQLLNLLWPISAPIQSPARVPSLSFAQISQLSTLHAPPSWLPIPTKVLSKSMTSSFLFSLSDPRFAQRTTLAIGVYRGPVPLLAKWMMKTSMDLLLECLNWWPSFISRTLVRSDAEMTLVPLSPTSPRIGTTICLLPFSHPNSMQLSCVLHAPASFSRPTSNLSQMFHTHLD